MRFNIKEWQEKYLISEAKLRELEFADQEGFKKYSSKHKVNPSTKVTIGGKQTSAGEASEDETKGAAMFNDKKPKVSKEKPKSNPIEIYPSMEDAEAIMNQFQEEGLEKGVDYEETTAYGDDIPNEIIALSDKAKSIVDMYDDEDDDEDDEDTDEDGYGEGPQEDTIHGSFKYPKDHTLKNGEINYIDTYGNKSKYPVVHNPHYNKTGVYLELVDALESPSYDKKAMEAHFQDLRLTGLSYESAKSDLEKTDSSNKNVGSSVNAKSDEFKNQLFKQLEDVYAGKKTAKSSKSKNESVTSRSTRIQEAKMYRTIQELKGLERDLGSRWTGTKWVDK
jgi:hypothetical protein